MAIDVKPIPPNWSAAVNVMQRELCKICCHLHPGGVFSRKNPCSCCNYDRERNGWIGHS